MKEKVNIIKKITDSEFKKYGHVLENYNCSKLIEE